MTITLPTAPEVPVASTIETELPEAKLHRFARWGCYATAGALPLYTVRWHYGPLPTTLLETLILLTVAAYVIDRLSSGVRRPLRTAYDIPIALLLVAGVISVIVATDHRGALGLYRAYFLEPMAIFYVAIDVLRRTEHVQRLLIAFGVGSSAFALLNLAVFYKALAANAVYVGAAPNALYGDANYVAMYMEPPFAFAAAVVMLSQTVRWRIAGAVWLALVGAALILSFSKGSYLAMAALALVAIITVQRWRYAIAFATAAALVIATQVPLLMARLATITTSLSGRGEVFGATVQMIRDHPIFGVGLGGYSYQFHGRIPEVYPHDIWLTFWVELGIAGVVAFGVILAGLLWRGWRAWPRVGGFYSVVLWGALGALVLWTVHGLVDSPYWKNDLSVEFWLLAALQVVALREARRN
jgi:O-antigen ligase